MLSSRPSEDCNLAEDMAKFQDNPLAAQYELQQKAFNIDPISLTPEERAEFFRWNFIALVTELTEASEEIGWKPWASSRHLNSEEYIGELVDAFHFLLNLILLASCPWETFIHSYLKKRRVNMDRQRKGYDGVSGKCSTCHRDIPTTPSLHVEVTEPDGRSLDPKRWICVTTNQIVTDTPLETPQRDADVLVNAARTNLRGDALRLPEDAITSDRTLTTVDLSDEDRYYLLNMLRYHHGPTAEKLKDLLHD